MTIVHSTITDPDLHEPKGASTASAGQVYLANGSGSGTWTTLKLSDIDVAAPATTGATGTLGQIAFDSGFLYICTATNTWKRVAIATW